MMERISHQANVKCIPHHTTKEDKTPYMEKEEETNSEELFILSNYYLTEHTQKYIALP